MASCVRCQVGVATGLTEQQPTSDKSDPNPLSGSLDLGKNGVTQENGYEQFKVCIIYAFSTIPCAHCFTSWPRRG